MIKHLEALEDGPRCRRWVLRVGLDKEGRKSRRFDGTKREALKALDAFAEELTEGRLVDRTDMRLGEYSAYWLESLERGGSVDSQTVEGYRWRLNAVNHILGKRALQKLTPRAINSAYAQMLEGDSKSGKPLSGTFVSDCHVTLRRMLSDAVKEGLMPVNPADLATPPKRDTSEKSALSDMEMRLLAAMLPTDIAASVAVILALTCGLRRGEACALRWEDVDLENGVLEVIRAARKDGSIKSTKTESGRRSIPLPDAARDALREWRMCSPKSDWVICGMFGEPLKPNAIGHWWQRHRHEYGCEGVTLHELRHTYITGLARAGVHPKVMQQLAGHSSPKVSLDVYSHLSLDDAKEAVARLNL